MSVFATYVESCGRNEDRLLVEGRAGRKLIVVADGAGGLVHAAVVAELTCARVRDRFRRGSVQDWAAELRHLDAEIAASSLGGSTTVVVAETAGGVVVGASVGDSEAWLVTPTATEDLTRGQRRKPLLGTGRAIPIGFGPVRLRGRLLVATDGLFKYVPTEAIVAMACADSLHRTVGSLVARARLRNGRLQDDIAVALYEDCE